jgi:hypothetical protein
VIAAHQDRQPPLIERIANGIMYGAAPNSDLVEVSIAIMARTVGVGGTAQVSDIFHVTFEAYERTAEAGDTQRLRAHGGSADTGTDVGWRPDQGNASCICCHGFSLV